MNSNKTDVPIAISGSTPHFRILTRALIQKLKKKKDYTIFLPNK